MSHYLLLAVKFFFFFNNKDQNGIIIIYMEIEMNKLSVETKSTMCRIIKKL